MFEKVKPEEKCLQKKDSAKAGNCWWEKDEEILF
jgi:hypothetical protein